MKRFFSVLILLVLVSTVSFSQTYKKGVNNLNVGIGTGLAGIYGDADFPPISVGFQYGFHEKISIGGIVGYSASTYGYGYGFFGNQNWEWTYTYLVIGARGEYHFVDVDVSDLDLYGGITLAYNIVSVDEPAGWSGFGYSAETSYLLYGFHAGARYLFTPNIGIFGELGYGLGYITVGLNVRL
jgi:hypothetical protein